MQNKKSNRHEPTKEKYSPTQKFSLLWEDKRRNHTKSQINAPLNSSVHHLKTVRYCGDVDCIKNMHEIEKKEYSSTIYIFSFHNFFTSLHTYFELCTDLDKTGLDPGQGQDLCTQDIMSGSWFIYILLTLFTTWHCKDVAYPVFCIVVIIYATLEPITLTVIWSQFCKVIKSYWKQLFYFRKTSCP